MVDVACGVRTFMYSALLRDERSVLLVLERSSFWVVVIDSWVVWVRPMSIRWTFIFWFECGSVWDSMAAFV